VTRFINADTLHSLQIIGSESHPHSHNQGPTNATSGSKEGLSVYGLFHHLARTPQGKYLLRQYFLRPSLSLDVIDERLDTITAFLRPENGDTVDTLVKDLQSVRNMRTMMINLRKGVSSGSAKSGGFSKSVWASIRQVCPVFEPNNCGPFSKNTLCSLHTTPYKSEMACETWEVLSIWQSETRSDKATASSYLKAILTSSSS
jgi:hypothetical protein